MWPSRHRLVEFPPRQASGMRHSRTSSEVLDVLHHPGKSVRASSVKPSTSFLMPSTISMHLPSPLSYVAIGQMQEDEEVEPGFSVMDPFRVSSQREQLVTPIDDFHFPFSQGSQEVPMRVSPALHVHELSSPILEKDGMHSQEDGANSLNSSY